MKTEMGSCEDSTEIDGPWHGSAIEQHSCAGFMEETVSVGRLCLEEGCNLIDSNVETNNNNNNNNNSYNAPDGCPGLTRDVSIDCVGFGDVVESKCLVGECLGSEKLLDDECGVSGDCLQEGMSGVDDCEGKPDGLCLENVVGLDSEKSLDDGCRARGDWLKESVSGVDDCTVEADGLCLANVVGLGSEKLLDDGCGASGDCLKESTSGVDDCNAVADGLCLKNMVGLGSENSLDDGCGVSGDCLKESTCGADGLCLEKEEYRGEYELINLLEGCKMSLEVMTTTGSPRDCVQEEEQKDEKSVSGLPEVGFMEEKSDALARLDTDSHDQSSSSKPYEMPSKLIPTTGSPRNFVQEDEHKDDMSTGALSVGGVMEDQSHGLAKIKKDIQDQMLPSQGCEMPSESIPVICLPRNCIQQDEQKDEKSVNGPSAEVITESIPVICLPRNCIQQDEQKDEKSVNGPSAEVITEVMEDKSDVLPGIETGSQSCEEPLDLVTVTGLQRNCVQQDKQKDDKSISGPSTEGIMELQEEKHYVLARIETDTCDQTSTSRVCEMPLKLLPMSGSPSSCAQQNEQMDSNGVSGFIAESGVHGKSDAFNGNKADMGNKKSFSQGGVMPSKLSCMHDLVSSCDGNTNHKSVSGLHGERVSEAVETKCVIDTVIIALPAQCHPKSLKNLRMVDKLSDCAQQNEQRVNKSAGVPSTESFPEVVEEKSGITTGLKVKISTQILPVEDNGCNSKDGSFVLAPSCFGKSGSLNCSEQTENEGKVSVGVDCVSETKCPGIVSSSSRRSRRISKSTQKTPRKGAARKCRNTAKVPRPNQSIEIIFQAVRRKRSCISKPARSSIWGNVTEFFKHSDGLGINQIQNQGLLEAKGVLGSAMQNKNLAGGSSWGSSRKCRASSSCLRLKVKLGKGFVQNSLNKMVPEVVDTSASANAINSDYGTELHQGTSLEFPKLDSGVQDKLAEEGTERQFQCFNKNLDKAKTYSDASLMDVQLENKYLEGSVILDKFAGDAADDCLGIPSHTVVEALEGATENMYIDPGTSPDSEVINLVPDAQVGAICQDELHDAVLTSSKPLAAPGDVISSKRGKKKDKLPHAGNCILEDRVHGASINKAKPSKKRGGRRKTDDGFNSSEGLTSSTSTNASSNSLSGKEFSVKPLPLSRDTDLGVSGEALKLESGAEANICCNPNVGLGLSELHNSNNMLTSATSDGHQLPKSSKSNGVSKGRSKSSDSAKSRRRNASKQGGSQRKLVNKSKVKEKGVSDQVGYRVDGFQETGNHVADDNGNRNTGDSNASVDLANLDLVSGGVVEQCFPPDNAWVSCDDCHKWRRIPVVLADSLGEHCRWVCKDNMDKAYADCSIPQEKSNADINSELGISDAEEDAYNRRLNYKGPEKGLEYRHITVPQNPSFSRLDTNEFLHRSRKTQTIDEIMVCHCKPPPDGQLGCGDECLNRMLNIECVQGTCPCGDLCSNQQFQKRKYAKMQWARCGKKGYGLQSLEGISKGQFLIEYVGEVLDMHAYEERQKEYALNSHKHFYFMTLNGSEVIDACAKGNLGRFINHSCDPNCRTEKWMVNGEICIGLFALRDIKQDEEVTFDYNYVRVFGAAAKKCFCGSPHCRGYIGGDPLNAEVIVQGDSDEEYPEPVMLEDGETWDGLDHVISRTSSFNGEELQIAESISKDRDKMDKFTTAVGQLEITTEIEDSLNRSASMDYQLHSSVEMKDLKGKFSSSVVPVEISIQTEAATNKTSSAGQKESVMEDKTMDKTLETSSATMMISKSSSDGIDINRKSRSDTVEDKRIFRKSRFRLKKSHSSGSAKKGKVSSNPPNGNKVQMIANKAEVLSIKPKKVMEGSSNGRFEAVQEKLNELLVADGGISKRKDAPKGYLKLLLLTAASGDSCNGEAIQSNRDLSMILDALLKTKSRVVLTDIINKNGLRMLHNIMKQYRRDFKKIPILRKLLKVLEYLAMREILTLEHINGGPPCPGMESFRESILSLTEHDDKQVHQIARNFRDRWIPRPVRKHSYMDRDDGRADFHRGSICNRVSTSQNHWRDQGVKLTEAIDCAMQSVCATTSVDSTVDCSTPGTGSCPTDGTKTRKRKSRWDQPAEKNPETRSLQHKEQKIDGSINADDGRRNINEDVPPGFSSPLNAPLVSSNVSSTATDLLKQNVCHLKCSFEVVTGHPQRKFISRLPVSYGVPLPIVQQFGSPQADTMEGWAIAPGMPFHPFPPLPPFPRDRKDTPTCAVSMTIDEPAQQGQQDSCGPATCYPDENSPSTTGADVPDMDISGGNIQQTFKRARGFSNDLCKRYFRQQKWNKTKMPPWLWRRNGQGYMGNSSRGGTCSTDVGHVTNDLRSSYSSEDVSCGLEKAGNDFYRHPQHHNHH